MSKMINWIAFLRDFANVTISMMSDLEKNLEHQLLIVMETSGRDVQREMLQIDYGGMGVVSKIDFRRIVEKYFRKLTQDEVCSILF